MKAKLLLAWRILVAAGMASVLFIAGLIVYQLYKDHYRYRRDETYTQTTCYSDSYVYEFEKGSVRLKDVASGKYLTPKLERIFDGSVPDSLTVFIQDGKRGFLNVYTGKIPIPAQYDQAWIFSEGLGAVVKDGQLGFIDYHGEVVIPFRTGYRDRWQERTDFLFKNGYCTFYDSLGKHGLMDKTGAWAIKPQYDYINNPVNGYRIVKKDNKYGLLDTTLQLVLPVEYDWIVLQKEGAIIRKSYEQKLLAYDLKTVLQPFVYDSLGNLYYNSGLTNNAGEDIYVLSDYRSFSIGGRYGLINKSGKVTVPPIYENISSIGNDLFSCKVTEGGYYITINGKGEVIQ